jgi:hypothetical protein
LGGFALVFAALSLSKFKLPHYIFITFPFAAVMSGVYVAKMEANWEKLWARRVLGFHVVLGFILLVLGAVLIFGLFPQGMWPGKLAFLALALLLVLDLIRAKDRIQKLFWSTAMVLAVINIGLGLVVYPNIMRYQSGGVAGQYIAENGLKEPVYAFLKGGRSLDFYCGQVASPMDGIYQLPKMTANGPILVYTNQEGYDALVAEKVEKEVLLEMLHYPPNKLRIKFLNPASREKSLIRTYLLKIPPRPAP